MTTDDSYVLPLIRCMVVQAVRDGELHLVGRTDDEVRRSVIDLLRGLAHLDRSRWVMRAELDYVQKLGCEGGRFADEDQPELAVVMYATAVEHWVNGMLSLGLRRSGQDLSRESEKRSLFNKLTVRWPELFDAAFPEDLLLGVLELAGVRNDFVHYKWPSRSEDDTEKDRAAVVAIANRAPGLLAVLRDLEDAIVFDNDLERLGRILDDMGLPTD